MKKILTSLALLGAVAGGAYAQKNIDIQVDSVLAPTFGEQIPNMANGDSIIIAVTFTNLGTDDITADDTLTIWTAGDGVATNGTNDYFLTSSYYGFEVASGASDTILMVIKQGDSYGGGVSTQFPSDANDTFSIIVSGVSPAGAYTDPGFDQSQETIADALGDNSNNIIGTYVVFGNPGGTGLADVNHKKTALNIYPNPANANVNVKYNFTSTTEAGIRVVDVTGRTVINNNLGKQAAGEKVFTVDVSSLAPGMYTVELVTDDVRAISKLTVTK